MDSLSRYVQYLRPLCGLKFGLVGLKQLRRA